MKKVRLGAIMIVSSFLLAANGAKAVKSKSFARESPRQRIERIDAAKEGELRLRPTFVSCGFSFGAAQPVEGAQLEFREKGSAGWTPGTPELLYFKETKDYRGSILDLKEDTQYEMRLVAGGKAFAEGSFRTWASEVPVARTVVLDPDTFKTPFVISDRGTADGWIRYTAKKGATLRNTDAALCSFVVTNAAYVLIDDIVLRDYTGDSFRDLTRIAHINENMWSELFFMNKEPLLKEMNRFIDEMVNIRDIIEKNDTEALKDKMRLSTKRRELFNKK